MAERGDVELIFGVLGPVAVWDDGGQLPAVSGRERLLLATLLLNTGRVVPTHTLIDGLWQAAPPTARAQLHNMISKLRRRLPAAGDELIVFRTVGYELRLGSHVLDLLEFRRLVSRGREAAADGDHVLARSALAEALSLWRGPALENVTGELAHGVRAALHEERLAATEARLDAELALKDYDAALAQLPALIAEHPFRENLHEKHMLALVGAGQRADALAAYQRVYRQFVAELGFEPGGPLRDLQQQIARGETATTRTSRAVPRQLPPQLAMVTGRDDLLAEIADRLRAGHEDRPPVGVLVGPGGIGKTTLALTVGHRLGEVFADGQLYADLRGSTDHPADAHAVVGRFLRALGVRGSALPDDRDERIAMYRNRLAGTRTLVVLDDAAGQEQVRPLLPVSPPSAGLVTSRRQLGTLPAAGRWTVPALAPDAAMDLLVRLVGAERVTAEPDAAEQVVTLCGRLPLAVAIAGVRLAAHPEWTLAELRQRLADERSRLDELSVGDLDVRASIGLTYQTLSPDLRRLLRRLGFVAAPDWPAWVADELAGEPASGMLDQLIDAHLVEPGGRDPVDQARFRLHDLVAAFARERAIAEEQPHELTNAQSRLLSGWLALVTAADELISHGSGNAAGLSSPPVPSAAVVPVQKTALPWCEAERVSLTAAVDHACRLGLADIAGKLAMRLSGFLQLRAHGDDLDRVLHNAIEHMHGESASPLRVRLLNAHFLASLQRSRYAELAGIAERELTLARRLDNPQWQANALHHAGVAALMSGRLPDSTRWFTEAVAIARESGLAGQALARPLRGLADAHAEAGYPDLSLPLFEEALAIERTEKPSRQTAILLRRFGMALIDVGRLDDAGRVLAESVEVARRIGDEFGVATIEQTVAALEIRDGRHEEAAVRLNRLLEVHEAMANQDGVAAVLSSLGDLAAVEDRWPDAVSFLRRAVDVRRQVGEPLDVARALARLERAHVAVGDLIAAAECRRAWQPVLAELGLDERCLFRPPFPPLLEKG